MSHSSGSRRSSGFSTGSDGNEIARDDPTAIDTSVMGTMPSEAKLNAIFTRMLSQLDYLNRTAGMMSARLDYVQQDLEELSRLNFEQ
jgi:hypothetical protein